MASKTIYPGICFEFHYCCITFLSHSGIRRPEALIFTWTFHIIHQLKSLSWHSNRYTSIYPVLTTCGNLSNHWNLIFLPQIGTQNLETPVDSAIFPHPALWLQFDSQPAMSAMYVLVILALLPLVAPVSLTVERLLWFTKCSFRHTNLNSL